MSEGRFVLPEQETVTMSGDAARRLLGSGSGDAALLYIYILQNGGVYRPEEAAKRIGRSEHQVENAMGVLVRLGLAKGEEITPPKTMQPAEELPEYTADDIKRELENGAAFRLLVGEVQSALGKVLSSSDLMKLFGIYDHLGLPPEVILQLITHCRNECTRRYGEGRIPTMRFIEREAYVWEREGIMSLEAAEEYIKRCGEKKTVTDEIAAAVGITGRRPVSSELKFIEAWADLGFKADAAAIAYDRTVMQTGKLAWRYMDSIMRSWHQKGLHTEKEIMAGDTMQRKKTAAAPAKEPERAAATAADLDSMKETLRRIKGGE